MSGFQKFIALGNVTGEPEIHRTNSGKEIAKFSIAVNGFKDSVEYFDIAWWEPKGILEYIQKGIPLLVEGELQKESWTDREGNKKHKWVVNARRVMLVGQRQGGRRTRYEEGEGHPPDEYDAPQESPVDDDTIPF